MTFRIGQLQIKFEVTKVLPEKYLESLGFGDDKYLAKCIRSDRKDWKCVKKFVDLGIEKRFDKLQAIKTLREEYFEQFGYRTNLKSTKERVEQLYEKFGRK